MTVSQSLNLHKRPFLLWLICLIYLFLALIELLQMAHLVSSWNLLLTLRYQPGPIYSLFTDIFFFLFFVTSAILVWLRLSWAPECAGTALTTAAVYFWLDRLVLAINPPSLSSQLFNLIFFFIFFGLIIVSLGALKPSMKTICVQDQSRKRIDCGRIE